MYSSSLSHHFQGTPRSSDFKQAGGSDRQTHSQNVWLYLWRQHRYAVLLPYFPCLYVSVEWQHWSQADTFADLPVLIIILPSIPYCLTLSAFFFFFNVSELEMSLKYAVYAHAIVPSPSHHMGVLWAIFKMCLLHLPLCWFLFCSRLR